MPAITHSIDFPGQRIASGEATEALELEPEAAELQAFEDDLEAIAAAEREAAADADLIHLA